MPVYNTGNILHLAVKSILAQTYTNWELLLIDDGSTDDTPKICDEYQIIDSRIRVFHKKNGGICESRNFGLHYAEGDYIAFCDHDDEFDSRLLEIVLAEAENSKSEIVNFQTRSIYDDKRTITNSSLKFSGVNRISDISSNLMHIIASDCFKCVWSCLYERNWLKKIEVTFDTRFKHGGEDIDFNLRALCYVTKISLISNILYTHYIRKSLSTSARYYSDLYFNQMSELPLLNRLLDVHHIDHSIVNKDYAYFVAAQIRFTIMYGIQCHIAKCEIISRLKNLYCQNRLTKFNVLQNMTNSLLVFLLMHRAFNTLYLLGLFKSYIK